MVKILGRSTSGNVQKVVWLLEELAHPYTREDYGRQFNNTQTESYLKLNPSGKVPTLVDGDVVVWESNTILRYLCSKSARCAPSRRACRSQPGRALDGLAARVIEWPLPRSLQRIQEEGGGTRGQLRRRLQGVGGATRAPREGNGRAPLHRGSEFFDRRYLPGTHRRSLLELPRHAAGGPGRQSLARQDRVPGRLPEVEILSARACRRKRCRTRPSSA